MQIIEGSDGFYFTEEHAGDDVIKSPRIYFSGYSLVLGPWLYLIGEDVYGHCEFTTGVFKVPETFQFDFIDGLLVVGHLQRKDPVPFATVVCLEPIRTFRHGEDITKYVPTPGYINPEDENAYSEALNHLKTGKVHILCPGEPQAESHI